MQEAGSTVSNSSSMREVFLNLDQSYFFSDVFMQETDLIVQISKAVKDSTHASQSKSANSKPIDLSRYCKEK